MSENDQSENDTERSVNELLAVDYITDFELRKLRPISKPLPSENELDEAECHNCGEPWDDERWTERHMSGGPSLGEHWKYECPQCGFETFEVGI